MTHEEKLEKLVAFLKADIESLRSVSDSFANTKDYVYAQKFLEEARTLEIVLWMLEDEEFLEKQWKVFYKDMDK